MKENKFVKCQCPEQGVQILPDGAYWPDELISTTHAPNECLGTRGLKAYLREGKSIDLCSTCHLSGDVPQDGVDDDELPPGGDKIIFEYRLRQTLGFMVQEGLIEVADDKVRDERLPN